MLKIFEIKAPKSRIYCHFIIRRVSYFPPFKLFEHTHFKSRHLESYFARSTMKHSKLEVIKLKKGCNEVFYFAELKKKHLKTWYCTLLRFPYFDNGRKPKSSYLLSFYHPTVYYFLAFQLFEDTLLLPDSISEQVFKKNEKFYNTAGGLS